MYYFLFSRAEFSMAYEDFLELQETRARRRAERRAARALARSSSRGRWSLAKFL